MISLYRATQSRFLKNIYFICGCIIAFTVTFMFASGNMSFPFLENAGPARRMYFISAAMFVYYTVFIPVYTNADYTDGTIRNKLIAGYTQTQVFISFYLAYAGSAAIMWLCYMAGGIAGGAKLSAEDFVSDMVLLIALFGFIAVLLVFSFRLTKTVAVVIAAGVIFSMCFNMIMFGNLIIMLLSENGSNAATYVASLVYNVNAIGQWFVLTGYADDVANPGTGMQLLISVIVTAVATAAGCRRLNKRDIV